MLCVFEVEGAIAERNLHTRYDKCKEYWRKNTPHHQIFHTREGLYFETSFDLLNDSPDIPIVRESVCELGAKIIISLL